MATEADVPEAICIAKGEGVDRSVPIEQLHRTVDQCSPVELNKSKGDLDQHPETHTDKPFADGENVQVEYSMKVESKNDSFGISEGEHFLDPLSEISQAGQSNQAGMEIPKNEAQLQKGTQVGEGVQETGTEENEVIEERQEKFEQDIEKHDIVNAAGIISEIAKTGDANLEVEEVEASTNETTVDQHVQVISNQQDSIKEDVQCLEKEAESSEVDTKGAEKAHGNAESYSKEASDLLEATTFQEYEASTSILDLTNSRLKKDMELETNVHNSSDTNPILQEEFEEGTSTKVTSNDEEDSQQTLQNYELKEELQKLPEVTPEDAKTESAMENAEVISCTEQERTMQSTPEYSEKEEANPVHCPKENATMTEEVFEAASTEQETAEHALPEIHTAENHPQEFNEEKSRDYQASVEAAYLSTHADEKNLEEQAIQEKSSSLVEEETTQQISREEEVHATNSKEEEKEADTKCEEPIEVADATREIEFETIEQRTETNKDLNVPIPEEEAYAEESTKAFVQNNSFLSEVSEVKTKEIIQEDQPTVGDYGLVSGELSQVSASKEAEAENEGHVNNTPEEMGLQTILTDETVVETEDHAQAGENLTSKEKIEKEIQTAEGEGERDLKEIKEENKEPVDNADIAPEEDLATILTDQPALQIEDIKLQAEESVDSKDKSEEQILTAADEGGNGLIEAQTENNEQVTDADIASEEKGLETILTDETALDIKDIDVQAEKDFRSKESSEKQVPVVADEGDTFLKEAEEEKEQEALPTILKGEPPLDIEVIDVQAEESFSPQEKLEELIPAVADEGDTGLKEAEEENKEQVKITDSAPEVKVTIGERALDNEDIELQVEENVSSKDNLEKQIPTTALEGDSGLKEPEEENELVKSIDISTEEKGPATILTDETTHNAEDTDVKASKYIKSKDIEGESCSTEPQEENKEKVTYIGITPEETILNSQEKLEEQVPEVAEEGDTGLNEAEEENKEQIKSKDTSPEEKGLQIISTDDTALDSVKIELQSEENVSSTDNLEKQIPTEEAERGLTEAEAENKEQATITDITPEVKSVPTTLTDQTALDSEKIELHAEEKVNSTDYLEKQIPTAADEGEDILTEAKAESKEQVTINDITPEEKGVATILTDERSLEIEDIDEQAEESSNSKENLEEEISAAPVLGETCVKEDEEESTEQVKSSNSSHEGKGLATILTEETTQDIEYTDVKAGADFNSGDILEKQIPTAVYEGETDSKEVEAENKEQVETTEIAPEEKGLATILIDETAEGIEVIDVQAGEINLKEVLEKQIPTAVDEGETDLKEAEADIKEQVETTDIVPEQKGVDTILSDERALDLEDVHVQEQENFNSNENLESQIPTTVGEGETDLNEGEAEIKEQVKCTETAVEEKDATTILRDETVVEVQDVDIKAEEKPIEAGEGEKKVGILDDIPVNVYNTELVEEVTVEQSYQVPSHEEAEPKIAVEDEKSEDHPERNHMIVEEPLLQVIDEPKITSRDFSEEQIIEGNVVSFTPESIEEDTVKSSQDNEKETIELKEEGSCTENAKDENASDLTREYIPEDAPKQIIDEQYNAVKSENKILEDSQTIEVDESSTCETKNIEKSEEIPSTLPVQYEEVQQGEESCTESTKEENASDHTREYVPEDATEQIKDEDCNTVESKNEVLEDSQIVEVDESTTCETKNLETTEEIPSTLPVKYDEVLQGEGSYTESPKEENASDLTREYVPEDATEQIKDEDCNAVKSKNEILEDSQTVEVDESTTCETKNLERSEEILSTLPVKYDEVQQGEGSSPAPAEPLKEEDTLSVLVAKDDDGDSGAVTNTETDAKVPPNDEEDSPEVLQKYEPEEEITELPHVKPEETTPESSSENAEVITCRKEEIQESLDKEKDTKESDTSSGEVLETTITEALPEIHTVEDTAERATEYQACIEAAELSTEGEKENSEEQTTREVSSSLIVETSEESSKEEEEKNEGQVECKDSIEEVISETLEDTTEPKPISEEESNKSLVQDNSFSLEASEKEIEKEIQGEYSSTVRSFDSKVVSDETGLTEATTEDKGQVKTTHISSEEKDNEGTDVHNTELVRETVVEPSFQVQTLEDEAAPKLEVEDETDKSDDLPEKNNKICEEEVHDGPKITDRDFNEEQITEANVANLTTEPVQEQEMVKDYQAEERETERLNEEGSSIENIKEGNASDISTECVPEDIDEKLKECIEEAVESKEQIIEAKAVSFTPESIEDDTVKNSQDSEKETIELKEEESCTESIKEENASELSPEYIQEDGSKNFKDDKEDALKSEEEILEDSQTVGVVESTTCETVNVERSEDILIALPAKYDEGSSPAPTEASKQENIDEDTSSVQETKDKDVEVTVTETSAEAPSNDEDDSPQVLQKYEPEEELTILRDAQPEEMKPEPSSEIEEVITCTKEETQESLDNENDTKESDASTGEACIEAAELSTEGEKEEQTTQEVSSSPIGEETTEESSKEEEKKEAHEECKEAIEGESSFLSQASEKEIKKEIQGEYGSTVRSFDSEVASDERGLTEATEQVETTHIAPEEKDIGGKDVYNTGLVGEMVEPSSQVQTLEEEVEMKLEVEDETDKSDDHPEKGDKICEEVLDEPKITDTDFHEEQITEGNVASCASESVEEGTVKDYQADEKERGSDETSLMVATTEDKEQVETTQIAPEEKYNEGTDVYNTELVGETVEPSFQGQTLEEEATPKLEVEDDTDKSDDLPEKNNKICEEVPDEPKITDRDFNEEQITEGIVTNLTTEPIEEQEMVKDYQGKERETERSNEEGSSIENIKESNANDISTECVPEDTGEKLKECIEEAVESKEQIIEGNFVTSTPELIEEDAVENSQDSEKDTIELKEVGTCTERIKEENATELSPEYIQEDGSKKFNGDKEDALKSEEQILEDSQTVGVVESTTCETVNVKRSEDIFIALPAKYDEGSSPAPTEASKQENIDEDTSSVQETKDKDGAVTVTETSAEVPSNDEDDSPQVLQKYEPEEELTILRDVQPEEMKPEPSSEIEEVITCTKEETQESLDKEKDAKESDTSTGETCIEVAELSTEGEKEEQTTQEVSSSLIGEETTEESPEEEENKEAHEECKEVIEGASSFLSKASEKEIEKEIQGEYSSTVRSFDSEVASDERGLTEATEQVETTCIAPEEKDIEGTDVYNTELVGQMVEPSFQVQTLEEEATPKLEVEDETDKSDDLPEKNNKICEEVLDEPKITDRDFKEEQITEGIVANLTTVPIEEQEMVKDYQGKERETEKLNEEGSSIENIKEGSANDISTVCVPEDIDEKLKECIEEAAESKKQIIEGNVTSLTPESIEEDTVKNSQDSEKETIGIKEEGTCTESIKEENATELSPEYIQEDGSKKFNDDKEDALKSEEQILEDSQTVGVVESTTCETVNVERSEDTLIALPAKYDEGSSPAPTEASKQENIDEDTSSVQETKDKDGAVTVTETSAEAPSNDEDDSPQVLQKYEPEEELTILRDVPPEEMKPELSNEIEEVITCTKEETQESLDKEKDAKESDTSTGEACIEAAELSTEGEKEEQITQEVSSSLIGEETTEESSKEEEKKDAHEECKEAIEGDSSFLSNASEKEIEKEIQGEYSSTVRSFDSEVASDERGLTEATEQVETTHIALEEKDIGGKDVYNTELVGETVEPSSQVQTLEEKVETKLEVEDETDKSDDHPEKGDKICEEVRDEPKITDRDFNEEQITGGNVASCASGSVEEETVKDDQGDQKERDGSKEEGSSIENIKEGNASVISTESVPKDIVEERTGEAVESKQEILQESQKDDRDEETFPIKVAEDNDDYNSTVVLSEAGAEVTSIGEESSEVAQILELGEKHAQVETSDLADEIEVRDLEDKVSVAETTEEETKEVELSNLALEKLDSDAPEEETTESFEVVPEFDSKSTDVVAQDEVTADQTLDEEISKEPSTLPSEEKEVKASEAEHAKEAEVPTEEDRGDLLAARSAEETYLPKEEPRELRVSELALERLDAGETEEETKENSETVSKFDSQSIGVVSEDEIITDQTQCEGEKEEKTSELVQETLDADAPEEETKDGSAMVPKVDSESIDELVKEDIIADQTLPEGISTEQLQIPSTALLPKEKELEASEHEHETTSVDKNIEKDNLKEVEVPADEDKQELFAATPTETCLQTEEPRDSELALHKLDAGETEDEIKETFETVTKSDSQSIVVACGDEIVVDQTLCEGITDTPLSKERELGASELALEKLDAVNTEEIKENPEIVPKFDSGIIVVSSDEITIDQTLNEEIMKEQIQSPSSTLLPEEKEHETSEPEPETTAQDKSTEQECTKEVEMSADDNMQALLAARPVEEECLQKEEPSVLSVSEEANETFETVSRSDFPSIAADPKEEITADKTLSEGVTDVPIEISSYTPLHEEKEPKASELDLEKLDADTTEEEIKEGSEVIPQSVSQSSCEVSKDEIIADQLEVPSFALLPDENELKASEHEHETIIDDKNIEDENLKEVEEPTDEASQDVLAARSAEETCLHKEEPSGLKVPELAVEKLEADETEEVKQAFETVSKSGSQSINAVSQDDTIADQTLSDVLTDMPLDIPSDTSLPKENEEVKEAATKLALEKLDADAAEEVKKGSEVIPQSDLQSIDVVVKDEIIADQVLHECMTKEQLLIQSPTLLPEEKELKEIEHEHKNLEEESAQETEVTADEGMRDVFVASSEEKMHLQKEEPRELKVSELSPENVGEGEEEVTATFESTDAVSREQTIAEQTLDQNDEQLQIASPTLLPKEKEEATEQKEELEDCKVLELSPKGETEEETKETFETVPGVSSQSIGELATDEIVDQNPPSSKGCENITTINNAGEESMNVVETPNEEGRKDTNSAEETSIPIEEPRELNVSGLDPSSQYTERGSSNEVHEEEEIYIDSNEAKKNEASNEEKNLKVATSDSRAEDSSETTIEANQTAKIEVPNEEIKEEKEVAKDSQLISVGEVNTRESQQENESRHEKYPEEKNDTFTAPSEYHHEVPEVDKTGSVSEDIEKQVKPDDKSSMDHSQYEAEGRIQETAIHLGLENQGDETNCENRTREVTYPVEKDSSVEAFQGVLGVEETDETTHNTKQLEKESDATDIPSSKDDALSFLQDPKLEDSTPSNDTLVARETKEENFCESGIETADPTSAQIPLSERLMDESTKERMKVVTHLTEEKEPTVGKELQADNEEEEEHENVEEAKTDEEKEDTEHKRAYQGYDEPVIVEASRDTEVKVKKSHNILSGMGSKVKHSISKVKKAIIGKSSNSKTQSEK
ncbi:titin isoform X3 [Rosa chinensis]|uniref:titin isoform X3 n=1 Tax=Rosa chinensis TaxID=74649 RepID=UPI000D088D73|nr:titin isoform X3 [Rosa chinensis]